MKRIFKFSLFAVAVTVLLASCTKRSYYDDNRGYDESGIVTYISEVGSPYSVVRMDDDRSYGIIYSVEADDYYWPLEHDVLIGNFSVGGSRTIYNKTAGHNIRLEVDEFFRYENDAINAVIRREDNEGYAKAFKSGAKINIQRRVGKTAPSVK